MSNVKEQNPRWLVFWPEVIEMPVVYLLGAEEYMDVAHNF